MLLLQVVKNAARPGPNHVAVSGLHRSAQLAVKDHGGPAFAVVKTKPPCGVGGCRARAWSTPEAPLSGLWRSAHLTAKDRGGSSNAMVKTM
jgi:hypothetical protein